MKIESEHAQSVLSEAMGQFKSGKIGELELIAIELACNASLRESMAGTGYVKFSEKAEAELLERAEELSRPG